MLTQADYAFVSVAISFVEDILRFLNGGVNIMQMEFTRAISKVAVGKETCI